MTKTANDILENIRANKTFCEDNNVRRLDAKLRAQMRDQLVR